MYDPKFEKAVQQRMEELEFRPSESVWATIERAVSGQRRRRAIPFFWRLMVPAVLLTVAAGAYYFGERAGRKGVAPVGPVVVKTDVMPSASMAKKEQTGRHAGIVPAETAGVVVTGPAGIAAAETAGSASVSRAGHERRSKAAGRANLAGGDSRDESSSRSESSLRDESNPRDESSSRSAAYPYRPGLEDQRILHGVSAAALAAEKGMVRLSTLSRVRRPWEAGFVAGGGIDRLNRLDASQANNAVSYMAASLYSLNRTAVSKNSISDVQPDASFYAGIYLQKPVSDRWIFNLGLDLHYYSIRMSIGQQVNTFVPTSNSLLLPTTLTAAPTQMVYTVGNEQTYTNRYYMLELPVAMQYRINRSRILPLFLEGGVSVSRLMGANALFYNPTTGLYLKSEDVLNKTQFDLSSSLLIGLPFHGIRIQAGPQVQYGLTPLINSQGLGDQHFFYTGIRLVVLPGRK